MTAEQAPQPPAWEDPPLDPDDPARFLNVGCPKCHAIPGQRCKMLGGGVHPARANYWRNENNALNPVDDLFGDAPEGVQRWQYAVVNIGMFKSADRMAAMLASAGSRGWELAATVDKQSNWFAGMEKGFLLLKRPVPAWTTPEQWCITVRS